MKIELTLKPRKNPFIPVEAEAITPVTFLEKEAEEIKIWGGNREKNISEIFEVKTSGKADSEKDVEIEINGNCFFVKRVGEYMKDGKITVNGNIGMHCGNFMSGGVIEISGNSDSWLGREMKGGEIICRRNTGHYCGSGYRGEKTGILGGKITVEGNAGDFIGEFMAGGEIICKGSAGSMPGAEMLKGGLTIYGNTDTPCANMRGGTCYILGEAKDILPTFKKTESVFNPDFKKEFIVYEGDYANRSHKGKIFVAKQDRKTK
ncbi:formylmethanofuran dehydrogenase subunit C [Methanomicrobium antiquum]|uniref:formylmethanofuran dehydrogenase n=1 Tax=Methanomicrobium antiquum TaxID=487686 RepID=A0AAF0FR41_9EURY|nr:formylmethanofuran dehydrogenase subunit C [Methanomicrobium antiquum]MDD3977091.1 formylmethanofuran dehydrogenase subunit C [Methanomicrobium sp.]WFN37037.1 formylmethanofuran dehydrogenase subunit C [Methanomicrobium antiquum]